MTKYLLLSLCLHFVCASNVYVPSFGYSSERSDRLHPSHQYRPVRTHHYPNEFQTFRNYFPFGDGQWGFQNGYPYQGARFAREFYPNRYYSGFYQPYGTNAGFSNKNFYDQGSKNDFELDGANKQEQSIQNSEGHKSGNVNVKNSKSNSDRFNEEVSKEKSLGEGKRFLGNGFANQEGSLGTQQKENSSHKKGHVVKGFKTYHNKNEDAKTEEFYDEAHDEGGNQSFGGHLAGFAKNAADSEKLNHDNKNYMSLAKNVNSLSKSGHHLDTSGGDHTSFSGNQRQGKIKAFDFKNDANKQSILENQEISKVYGHHPYIIPFLDN